MKEIRELHGEGVFSWGEVHTGCGLSLSVVDMLFIGGNYSALFDAFTVNDKMVMATVGVVFTAGRISAPSSPNSIDTKVT